MTEKNKTQNKKVGDQIEINGKKGVIKYIGVTKLGEGVWYGIELDKSEGDNNGTIKKTKYFECEPKHGIFLPEKEVLTSGEIPLEKMNHEQLLTRLRKEKMRLSKKSRKFEQTKEIFEKKTKLIKEKGGSCEKILKREEKKRESKTLKKKIKQLKKQRKEKFYRTEQTEITIENLKDEIVRNTVEYLTKREKDLSLQQSEIEAQIEIEHEKRKNLQSHLQIEKKKLENLKQTIVMEENEVKKITKIRNEEIKQIEEEKKKLINSNTRGSSLQQSIIELEDKINKYNRQILNNQKKIQTLQKRRKMQRNMKTEISKENKKKKSQWVARLMNSRPELLHLREKMRPVLKNQSFGRLRTTEKILDKSIPNSEEILQFVMQHYEIEGKKKLRDFIEEVTGIEYEYQEHPESILITLIRLAIQKDNRIWDLTQETGETLQVENTQEMEVNRNIVLTLDDDDVNVWEEPENCVKNIVVDEEMINDYKNGQYLNSIHLTNVNKLIEHLIHPRFHDEEFIQAFLMTYHEFLKPEHLFLKVVQRYRIPPYDPKKNENLTERQYKSFKIGIQRNSINFLEIWITEQIFDFSPVLLNSLRNFIQNEIKQDWPKDIQMLLQAIKRAQTAKKPKKKQQGGNLAQSIPPPDCIIPKSLFSINFKLDDVKPIEMARQLTFLFHELYLKIQPSELVSQAWSKPKLKHKAPNVTNIINKFNDCSIYIAEQIVSKETLKQRSAQFVRWIKVGTHIRELNNFDSLLMVISGINNSSCKRMKHTHEDVSKTYWKTYDTFAETMNNSQGYKSYRDSLDGCEPPALPYLGVYLTDLTFISDGSPSKIEGLINFSKRKLLYNVIREIRKYQKVEYNLSPIHQIQQLLKKQLSDKNEKTLYQISLQNEPRNTPKNALK
ncbi:guanine nucleotide exchange factor [Anaeramoeba flamelloides]|uniref:Guanine nucleotide exchange factor n=1 Tax=Anaeramoeba flamelloides TaxID=1746091 RepID=A0ABQ8Y2G2_9EUKA|nr:guanine nucleotide exchange factor [Anaeramoeba flamelloides]